jgi:osmoprotectant transport system permease protein
MTSGRLRLRLAGLVLLGSSFGLPVGDFKINRIMRPIPVPLSDLIGTFGVILVVFIGGVALWTLARSTSSIVKRLIVWSLALVPGVLIFGLSTFIPSGVEFNSEAARMALGAGYAGIYVAVLLAITSQPSSRWPIVLSMGLPIGLAVLGQIPMIGIVKEYQNYKSKFNAEFIRHLTLALSSGVIAILPGILMGYWAYKYPKSSEGILSVVNLFQVAPTLSLLGLIMIPLSILSKQFPFLKSIGISGIGFAPAFIVLTLYALMPIVANAYAAFKQLDLAVLESAKGMGLTSCQVLRQVSLPLASPIILSGIRTAFTQNIGNAILAGLVGGGGFGAIIFLGLSQSASDLVLLGTLPVVIMALITESVFERIQEHLERQLRGAYD